MGKAALQVTCAGSGPGSEIRTPNDPNNLVGPAGFGTQNFVLSTQPFTYTVEFENMASASASASQVVVTDHLDSNLDLSTFSLGDFGFGDITVHVPWGLSSYSTRVDARAEVGLFVDVTASLDVATATVTWTFTSIDPTTGDQPSDPFTGFLPPDTNPPLGIGHVDYHISPKANLATGAVINAKATVVFDAQAPLDTPLYSNTLDAGGPSSTVSTLSQNSSPSFLLQMGRHG